MKKMILISLLISSMSVFGVECNIEKNSNETLVLIQTVEDLTDEEEQGEENYVDIDGIQFVVTYLPFQEGIYLNIYDENNEILASNSDHESIVIVLNKFGNNYKVTCSAE